MVTPLRNIVYEKIKDVNSLTDVELYKAILKEEYALSEDKFNKILLDLEILGLITVVWVTKDERRVQMVIVEKETDDIEEQNKETVERDYEASFPGFEK